MNTFAAMPLVEEAQPVTTIGSETASAGGESPLSTNGKIRWRWGVLAALAMALLSLYPQIDLWITRGTEWHGAYARMFYDEDVYAAYINGLLLARSRYVLPLQVDSAKPPSESAFSIQIIPAYLLVLLSRLTGATVSEIFIVLTPFTAYFAALMIYYLLMLTTGDEIVAAVGALTVLLLGTPASGDTVMFQWLLGRPVQNGFFPFLRRYQPAVIFPVFFGYIALTWRALIAEGRKARWSAIGAGAVFPVIVFSYFYLWTAALAWLACLAIIWFVARRAEWPIVVKRLIPTVLFAIPALALYAGMLAHRHTATDKVLLLAFTHAPDFNRAPEWIALIVILLLLWGIKKQSLDWRQPVVLLTTSLAFVPFAVFNQQILTGRSLQPAHYEVFSVNYLSLLALILVLSLLWRKHEPFFARRIPRFALALLASAALSCGVIEANYLIRFHKLTNIERDRFMPVAKALTALAQQHSPDRHDRELVLSPDIYIVSDSIAAFTPLAPFWAGSMPYAGGLSVEERRERFFQYLYYCSVRPETLEHLLTNGDVLAVAALFGHERKYAYLTVSYQPLTRDEIQAKVREYAQYVAGFNPERALHPQLSYVIVYTNTRFDFSNIDRWYDRDIGELIGAFTLYQVEPLKVLEPRPDREQ